MHIHEVAEGFFVGPQPSPEDLAHLAQSGVRTVIDFRPPAETKTPNSELVRAAGLEYVNIPVQVDTAGAPEVQRFLEAVQAHPGPFLLHCGVGLRAGALYLIYAQAQHGWTAERALDEGQRLGFNVRANPKLTALVRQFARPAPGAAGAGSAPASR